METALSTGIVAGSAVGESEKGKLLNTKLDAPTIPEDDCQPKPKKHRTTYLDRATKMESNKSGDDGKGCDMAAVIMPYRKDGAISLARGPAPERIGPQRSSNHREDQASNWFQPQKGSGIRWTLAQKKDLRPESCPVLEEIRPYRCQSFRRCRNAKAILVFDAFWGRC
jgi:hypothetical protein